MKGKWETNGKQKNYMGMKGVKMKVSFERRKGKNYDFAAVFSYEINGISEYRMGTTVKIWIEA